jgi:glucokinase
MGGTNANFGVVRFENEKLKIVFQTRETTSTTSDFSTLVNNFLSMAKQKGYEPIDACFAVAGPVENKIGYQIVKMTNTDIVIDSRDLEQKTDLKNILIINDFEAMAHSINVLSENDYIILNRGKEVENSVQAVIGAGTGLGKCVLIYSDTTKKYIPIPSEGGNADLPILDDEELKLTEFIKIKLNLKHQLCYENVLSGSGLENIYHYLNSTRFKQSPQNLTAEEISMTRATNPCSKEAFDWFIKFYARCARNFALDTLARGGLYIGGGIAAKNQDSFSNFVSEFVKNDTYKQILEDIPIYIITNYDISLIGAAYALRLN